MHIGIDFDNTIVRYDDLFHQVAMEQGVIPAGLPRNKTAVRDHLRATGREPIWTAMQGEVYGARLMEAPPFPGITDFLIRARAAGAMLSIISHKTLHPCAGPQYDLHAIARAWIRTHLHAADGPLIDDASVFFELTKEAKIRRIAESACDYFIDDLPEILSAPGFPVATRTVLFDPAAAREAAWQGRRIPSWSLAGSVIGLS